jgi:hypothetical protein
MKKILAFVLVLAFVLSLGSMVLATGDQKDSWRVEGWNAFYSRGQDAVDWVRPIYYDAAADNLYVLTKTGADVGTSAWVYVDHDTDFVNIGQAVIDSYAAGKQHETTVDLDGALKIRHAITVVVNTDETTSGEYQ